VSRRITGILLIVFFVSIVTVFAQDVPPPSSTEEAQPTIESFTPTPQPLANAAGDVFPILVNVRSDLQLLAINQLGNNVPDGWNPNLDINDPQLAVLLRLNLEILAGTLQGADRRPVGWFGTVLSTPYALARDIRHDLELLADAVVPGARPFGWIGDDPVMRCPRATQDLLMLLELKNGFQLDVDFNSPDYCDQIAVKTSQYAEIHLLQEQIAAPVPAGQTQAVGGTFVIKTSSDFAIAFFDRSARRRAGLIPNGTTLTAIGRSTAEFSKMTVVQGDGFEVFVDYSTTTLTADQFATLPDVNGMELTLTCDADWCGS